MSKLKELLTSANDSNCNILIGRKGSGKSTKAIELIENSKQSEKVIISPKVSKSQIIDNILLMNDFDLFRSSLLNRKPENLAILFDDAKEYINQNPNELSTKKIINWLVSSRHNNNMIAFVFHSFSQTNERFFSLSDNLYLFKTQDNITKFKNFFHNYDEIEKKFSLVNNHKSDNYHEKILI